MNVLIRAGGWGEDMQLGFATAFRESSHCIQAYVRENRVTNVVQNSATCGKFSAVLAQKLARSQLNALKSASVFAFALDFPAPK